MFVFLGLFLLLLQLFPSSPPKLAIGLTRYHSLFFFFEQVLFLGNLSVALFLSIFLHASFDKRCTYENVVLEAFLVGDQGEEGLILDHGATAGAAHEYDIADFQLGEPTAPPVKVEYANGTFFTLPVLRYQSYVVSLLVDA